MKMRVSIAGTVCVLTLLLQATAGKTSDDMTVEQVPAAQPRAETTMAIEYLHKAQQAAGGQKALETYLFFGSAVMFQVSLSSQTHTHRTLHLYAYESGTRILAPP